MNKRMVTLMLALAVAGLPAAVAVAANGPAQGNNAQGNAQAASSQNMRINDRQLKNFAEARTELNRLRTKYRAEMKRASSVAQSEQVSRQRDKAMRQALRRHGLTAAQFRQMAVKIEDTPELRQKLEAMEPDG